MRILAETWPQLSSRRSVLVAMAAFAGVVTLLAGVIVSEGLLLLTLACVLVKMASHATLQARTHTYIHTHTHFENVDSVQIHEYIHSTSHCISHIVSRLVSLCSDC